MEDDVIRGATVTHAGEVTFPPPPPKVAGDRRAKPKEKAKELTPEEKRAQEVAAFRAADPQPGHAAGRRRRAGAAGGHLRPGQLHAHFIVFVLAVFVGFQVIWNVSHSLHTPLMAVTNAISSIIILGALMQIGSGNLGGWS
jgi:H+-translocating NAD(P) transhydrogenase subunit alpha